jgi:biopolymer transport protein ExbD
MSMEVTRRGSAMAEINVTPMADVMIVLLIIFMVMTPLISSGQVRRLPPAAHSRDRQEKPSTLVVSMTRESAIYLGQLRLGTLDELRPVLQPVLAAAAEADRVVYVKADEGLPYSEVRRVLDACRAAGAEEVALIARRRIGG